MAATAIALAPIISAAIPLIKPLLQSLVLHVEKLFGAKTGQTKFEQVLAAATPIVNQLATAGKIPGTIDGIALGSLIETIVQEFKGANVLNPSVTLPSLPTSTGAGVATASGSNFKVFGTLTLG